MHWTFFNQSVIYKEFKEIKLSSTQTSKIIFQQKMEVISSMSPYAEFTPLPKLLRSSDTCFVRRYSIKYPKSKGINTSKITEVRLYSVDYPKSQIAKWFSKPKQMKNLNKFLIRNCLPLSGSANSLKLFIHFLKQLKHTKVFHAQYDFMLEVVNQRLQLRLARAFRYLRIDTMKVEASAEALGGGLPAAFLPMLMRNRTLKGLELQLLQYFSVPFEKTFIKSISQLGCLHKLKSLKLPAFESFAKHKEHYIRELKTVVPKLKELRDLSFLLPIKHGNDSYVQILSRHFSRDGLNLKLDSQFIGEVPLESIFFSQLKPTYLTIEATSTTSTSVEMFLGSLQGLKGLRIRCHEKGQEGLLEPIFSQAKKLTKLQELELCYSTSKIKSNYLQKMFGVFKMLPELRQFRLLNSGKFLNIEKDLVILLKDLLNAPNLTTLELDLAEIQYCSAFCLKKISNFTAQFIAMVESALALKEVMFSTPKMRETEYELLEETLYEMKNLSKVCLSVQSKVPNVSKVIISSLTKLKALFV